MLYHETAKYSDWISLFFACKNDIYQSKRHPQHHYHAYNNGISAYKTTGERNGKHPFWNGNWQRDMTMQQEYASRQQDIRKQCEGNGRAERDEAEGNAPWFDLPPTRIARLVYHVEEGNAPWFAQSPTMTRQRQLDFPAGRAYIIASPEVAYHDAEYCILMCKDWVFIF